MWTDQAVGQCSWSSSWSSQHWWQHWQLISRTSGDTTPSPQGCPHMMRQWTFATFLWPKRCALFIAYKSRIILFHFRTLLKETLHRTLLKENITRFWDIKTNSIAKPNTNRYPLIICKTNLKILHWVKFIFRGHGIWPFLKYIVNYKYLLTSTSIARIPASAPFGELFESLAATNGLAWNCTE